jgi:GGDEF domain-containing protein
MISIQSSISDLDRSHKLRTVLLNTYLQAIKSSAQYAVELDDKTTGPHRRHLTELAEQLAEMADQAPSGTGDHVTRSSATFRGLLRDYRDKAARYLKQLREELASTARALQETLDSLSQSAGDHETQLRKSVIDLREMSGRADVDALRVKVRGAADAIEVSLEQVRQEHQLTVAQFLMEIRVLHQRIDTMEAAASVDGMTGLYDRGEMEDRIRSARPGSFHLLLFQAQGISGAEAQFGRAMSDELAAAFAKRLKNSLPATATLGRWSAEEFIALVGEPRDPNSSANRWATAQLSGTYSCVQSGKTVRPSLQVGVGIVDSISRETAEETLDRVKMFLTGPA